MGKLIKQIQQFNAGREPERLAMKYRNMRSSAFVYLRATCHLFPGQLSELKTLAKAPAVWSCGDLHLENFGSYKGDNRLTYFDINDFDESALIPASWDLVRLLTSVRLACADLKFKPERVRQLIDVLLAAYFQQLRHGSARWLERDTASGPVHELLATVEQRKRKLFLDSRSVKAGKKRKLLIDGKKALAANKVQHAQVGEFIEKFAKRQSAPEFYEVLDVARRIAGNGSLGVDRFVVLVRGKGNPDNNYLLDLKQAVPSALTTSLTLKQPIWTSESERVVALTRRAQAVPVAFLHAVQMSGRDYVLRDLQPSADRVSFEEKGSDETRLNELMLAIGQCTAWSHLRGSGRQRSAIADELVAYGGDPSWPKELRKASAACADTIDAQWQTFAAAYDDKAFES
ncbi:MAG: DUF2252 family protein [Rhizobacter sp.]|nr:DUF2252 family protein [Burkholderiales bacterium]